MQQKKTPQKHLCQSCHCLIQEDENFCSICGQKKITKTASLREIIGEFFSNTISLDSKLIRTFIPLFFLPGKLTSEYLAGRRNLYYTPIRLFLFAMTITLILLNVLISSNIDENLDLNRNLAVHLSTHHDSLQQAFHQAFPDSIQQQKIEQILEKALQQKAFEEIDKEPEVLSLSLTDENPLVHIYINDLFLLEEEELIEKYNADSFWKQQVLLQFSKAMKKSNDFMFYMISHISWIILFSLPLVALMLKLLYIRQRRPYVEHLIYTLHLHTFNFMIIASSLIWLINKGDEYDFSATISLAFIIINSYFLISLKKVYQQGIIKTFFKALIFGIGYACIVTIAIGLFLVLNFIAY